MNFLDTDCYKNTNREPNYFTDLVSIIVPVYNTEEYLRECIDSILNQTYHQIEIILVDDGSTDSSGRICDEYKERDNRIVCIHTQNSGLVQARKRGIAQAKGRYITFVDADDYIDERCVETLFLHITDTGSDLVHASHIQKCGNLEIKQQSFLPKLIELDSAVRKKSFFETYVMGKSKEYIAHNIWSKMFKREIIIQCYNSLPDEQSYGEDLLCFLKCIEKASRIELIAESLYYYRILEESLSHNKKDIYLKNEIMLFSELIKSFQVSDREIFTEKNIFEYLSERILRVLENIVGNQFRIPRFYLNNIDCIKEKKVVLYGAGLVGQDIYRQISAYDNCDIVEWVDKEFQKFNFPYRKVRSVSILSVTKFDILLIAVADETLSITIKEELMKMGIAESKIIWYKPEKYVSC